MNDVVMRPGEVSLAEWRAIYRGAGAKLEPASAPVIAASAAAVERILARGEPVYGINTGFGKLASVRIEAGDLETLQPWDVAADLAAADHEHGRDAVPPDGR